MSGSKKIVLPIDVRKQIKDELRKHGQVNILGIVTLKIKKKTIKGRELIDPDDHLKGFRITDMNKTVNEVTARVSHEFKQTLFK